MHVFSFIVQYNKSIKTLISSTVPATGEKGNKRVAYIYCTGKKL